MPGQSRYGWVFDRRITAGRKVRLGVKGSQVQVLSARRLCRSEVQPLTCFRFSVSYVCFCELCQVLQVRVPIEASVRTYAQLKKHLSSTIRIRTWLPLRFSRSEYFAGTHLAVPVAITALNSNFADRERARVKVRVLFGCAIWPY